MLRLEKRPEPSGAMRLASPLIAAVAMLLTGLLIFLILGKNPVEAFQVFFIKPVDSVYGLGELLLKTTPLLLCALGLALGFRAHVWNSGAGAQRSTATEHASERLSSRVEIATSKERARAAARGAWPQSKIEVWSVEGAEP